MRLTHLCAALALLPAMAGAQSQTPGGMPPPPGMTLADSAAMRFPQPVRAGTLLGRDVLQPVESQNWLGVVHGLVSDSQGTVSVVVRYGGFLQVGGRLIAVPIDAMVLLGKDMEVVAFTPKQLAGFPTFTGDGTTPVAPDAILKVGLAKPSH